MKTLRICPEVALRAAADGKREGFPVVIIGGAHGDVPLEESAGKLIADLVVDRLIERRNGVITPTEILFPPTLV